VAGLGVRTTLICAVGRDGPGRALVAALRRDGVDVRAAHPVGTHTARIGMLVDAAGERSFVADRGAADLVAPEDLRPAWFRGAGVLHLPAYSLLGRSLGDAASRAVALARDAGAQVTVDLASAAPLLARGRGTAQGRIAVVAPDVLFSNTAEAAAFLGARDPEPLLRFAPIAIVKRGASGATILARRAGATPLRLDVATRPLPASDSTGAGDAFDAGFLASWLAAGRESTLAVLRRAVVAGNRVAARQIGAPRPEIVLG
jgi:sugar/nucleoside kinase (ribokinase family)